MPQTVPTGFISPDPYALYEENFDLSLLPMDGEVPLSPHSQFNIELSLSASDYIPATIFHNDTPAIKTEKPNWSETLPELNTSLVQQLELGHQQLNYYSSPHCSPQSQPDQYTTIFPPSPCPSLDQSTSHNHHQQHQQFSIKQEYIGLFPPSPPDSNGAPSPRCDIKGEPDTYTSDTETSIDIDSLLQNSFEVLEPKKQDHQLLREYLQDTSFQRKHNLKPLALESLLGGWGTRGDIEPVISLALEHAKKDVQRTCAALNISPGKIQYRIHYIIIVDNKYFYIPNMVRHIVIYNVRHHINLPSSVN